MKKIEILAPSGSIETLKVAVNAGADAIYIGGSSFSARASAKNFDNNQLIEAIDYAHSRDVRVYVAVNILIKDLELLNCINYIIFLYNIGVDAIIIQDIGLLSIIRDILPDLPIHLSTQSAISSLADIQSLEEFNIQRIVLPRETTTQEIQSISQNTDIELETFIHGALCVSYSGRCLFSALNGGRSGNRGDCAQACRKKYDLKLNDAIINNDMNRYVLSPKDLKTSDYIDKIIDSGVHSLKIEGRMKRKEYIYVCIQSYKSIVEEYITKGSISQEHLEYVNANLNKVFNRSFTKGYILGSKGNNIMNNSFQKPIGEIVGQVLSYDKSKKRLCVKLAKDVSKGDGLSIGESIGRIIHQNGIIDEFGKKGETIYLDCIKDIKKGTIINRTLDYSFEKAINDDIKNEKLIPLNAAIILKLGNTPKLQLSQENSTLIDINNPNKQTVFTPHLSCETEVDFEIQSSKNSPLSEKDIIKQISKSDKFPFELKQINIEKDENIFLPVKILNELRRKAFDKLYELKISSFKRNEISYISSSYFEKKPHKHTDKVSLYVDISNEHQLSCLSKYDGYISNIITSDINLYKITLAKFPDKAMYKTPSILKEEDYKTIVNVLDTLNNPKILFSSNSFINYNNTSIANYHLNIYNSYSHNYYNSKDIMSVASLENIFIYKDKYLFLENKNKVIIPLYIYPELMLTEFCPHKDENGKCVHDYVCKLNDTSITNEQGDVFIFEKFLNCKVSILSQNPYILKQQDVQEYIKNGYSKFMLQFKNNDDLSKINTLISQVISSTNNHNLY